MTVLDTSYVPPYFLPAQGWSALHGLPLTSHRCGLEWPRLICTTCLSPSIVVLACWCWAMGCHTTSPGVPVRTTWKCVQPVGWTFDHWETDADGQVFLPLLRSQVDYSEASSYGFLENRLRSSSNQLRIKRWFILLVFLSSPPHSTVPYSFSLGLDILINKLCHRLFFFSWENPG